MFRSLLLCVFMTLGTHPSSAAETLVTVFRDQVAFERACPSSGACLSFFNDDDGQGGAVIGAAFAAMHLRSLRYPMGTLAENYLAHPPDQWSDTGGGLRPIIASRTVLPDRLGTSVDGEGRYVAGILDFDEFMSLCRRCGCEPVVLVASHAHLLPGSAVTRDQVIANAVEWVRYANVTKGYGVRYWEIGNELDLIKKIPMTMEQYFAFYQTATTAMKAVDPTIRTGLGVIGMNNDYYRPALQTFPELVDFLVAHSYQNGIRDGQAYGLLGRSLSPTTDRALKAIDDFAPVGCRATTEVLVTEYSSHSTAHSYKDAAGAPIEGHNVLKGLITAETALYLASVDKRVRHAHFWMSQTPWGDIDATDHSLLTSDGTLSCNGIFLAAVAQDEPRRWLCSQGHLGKARVHAGLTDEDGLRVFLINRGPSGSMDVRLRGLGQGLLHSVSHLGGELLGQEVVHTSGTAAWDGQDLLVTCPGGSLTIVRLSAAGNAHGQ